MVEDRRKGNLTEVDKEKAAKGISQGTTVRYDPYIQIEPSGEKRTPRVGLSHELQHSYDADQGTMTREITENGVLLIEVRAINTENKIRMKTGDPKRTNMEEEKCLKHYWSKIILITGLPLFLLHVCI